MVNENPWKSKMASQFILYHPQLNTKSSSLLKRLAGRLRGRRFLRDPSNLICLIRKQNTEHNSKKLYTPGIDLIRPSRKNIAKHAKAIKDINGPQPSSSTHHIEEGPAANHHRWRSSSSWQMDLDHQISPMDPQQLRQRAKHTSR